MRAKAKMRKKIQKRWNACIKQELIIRDRYREAYRKSLADGYNNQRAKENLLKLAKEHNLKIENGRVR